MYEIKSLSKEELDAIDQDVLCEVQKDPEGLLLSFSKLSFNIRSPYHKEFGFYKNQELVAGALVFFEGNGNAPQIERFYVLRHVRGKISLRQCLKVFVLELQRHQHTNLRFYWAQNSISSRLESLWNNLFKAYRHEPITERYWLVDIKN